MISKQVQEKIIHLYTIDNLSVQKISAAVGIGQWRITELLKRNGIPRKAFSFYRKGAINENFFDSLTESSCWVLGWMFTDGTMDSPFAFKLSVHRNDEEVLEKIEKAMGINESHIRRPFNRNISIFSSASKHLYQKLVFYGCIPNKSLVLAYPNSLNDQQMWWCLRGILEGDGSIPYNKKSNYYSSSICSGSKDFAYGISNFLTKHDIKNYVESRIGSNLTEKQNTYYTVRINRRNTIAFLDNIYANAPEHLRLKRKYNLYLKAKSTFAALPDGGDAREASKIQSYILTPCKTVWQFKGIHRLSREIGINRTTLSYILSRHEGYVSRKFGWGKPTPDQIASARATGTLVTKFY